MSGNNLKSLTKEKDPTTKDNLYAAYKGVRDVVTRNKRDSKALSFSQFF